MKRALIEHAIRTFARHACGVTIGLLTLAVLAPQCWSQCPISEVQKLRAADGNARDRFGNAVALDAGTALIGAHRDDHAGPSSGSVYVFEDDGRSWNQTQKLTASDATSGDEFGDAVALDGDVLVVGAPLDDNANGLDAGAIYVFRYAGGQWTEEQKLVAGGGTDQDWFGWSVAVSNGVILVGAPFATGPAFNTGLATIYQFEGGSWVEKQTLAPEPGGGEFQFGHAVALYGNIAAVGAPSDQFTGAVYAFHHVGSSWVLQQRLTLGTIQNGDDFGAAVSLDGVRMLVGAPGQDGVTPESGAAHLFTFDGAHWNWQRAFWAPGSASLDRVGESVSLRDRIALIGAPLADADGIDSGVGYVYQESGPEPGSGGWSFASRLSMSDGAAEDVLGQSVATNGTLALLGAPWDDDLGFLSGSACLFEAVQDLILTVDPVTVDPWDLVNVTTAYGPAGNPALLAAIGLNGSPIFVPIIAGVFDANSRWIIDILIVPGLSGVTIDVQSFALQYCGNAQASNQVEVTFN